MNCFTVLLIDLFNLGASVKHFVAYYYYDYYINIVILTDTTRPKKPHEKEGVEYHFVTKQQFDADALNNKYVRAALFVGFVSAHVVCFRAVLTLCPPTPTPTGS